MIIKMIVQTNGWIKHCDIYIYICIYIYIYTQTDTHTVEYCLLLQREILSFVAMWMDLEDIMLSEISQTKNTA